MKNLSPLKKLTFICNRYNPYTTMSNGMFQLKDGAKQLRAKPKPKEQVLSELEELEKQLGLNKTNSNMKNTRLIVKRIGSLTDILPEIRENEQE